MDVSRQTGDAFGHGHVKATSQSSAQQGSAGKSATGAGSVGLGGQGLTHVIAAEAHLQRTSGAAGSAGTSIVTFTGHARLWQDANSVEGPTIVLDREKQTLVARSGDVKEPVEVVLLSAARSTIPRGGRIRARALAKAREQRLHVRR